MSKQSKRIKPNQPSMIAMAPGQQPNMQQGQQQVKQLLVFSLSTLSSLEISNYFSSFG